MAHWAELDENNIVIRVTVGNNADEDEGYKWLVDNLGGTWIKTSYNGNIRKKFAGIGDTYDTEKDIFIPKKPNNSWIYNEEKNEWTTPIPRPQDTPDTLLLWNEETVSWKRYNKETFEEIEL
jgi:hypothetical protein